MTNISPVDIDILVVNYSLLCMGQEHAKALPNWLFHMGDVANLLSTNNANSFVQVIGVKNYRP